MKRRAYVSGCVAVLLLVSIGCGGDTLDTQAVQGTITYNGEPVEGANVMFTPVDKTSGAAPAVAITDENGHYKLQTQRGAAGTGTTPGEYIVTVSKTEMVPTGETTTTPEGETEEVMEGRNVLPAKYKSSADSPLRATVKESGNNTFDFDLTD